MATAGSSSSSTTTTTSESTSASASASASTNADATRQEREMIDTTLAEIMKQVADMKAAGVRPGSEEERRLKGLKKMIRQVKRRKAELVVMERYIAAAEADIRRTRRQIEVRVAMARFIRAMGMQPQPQPQEQQQEPPK